MRDCCCGYVCCGEAIGEGGYRDCFGTEAVLRDIELTSKKKTITLSGASYCRISESWQEDTDLCEVAVSDVEANEVTLRFQLVVSMWCV